MSRDRDYILGTHDEEIERLGLQHSVWRPRALMTWRKAGFTAGHTLLDVGCGPGYATRDLADIAGANGRVVAIDRSRRFLDVLEASGRENVTTFERDLDADDLPDVQADGAWIRWVFAFVKNPRNLLRKIVQRVKPGGTIAIHEYFDYSTWRIAPRSELFENFVTEVMESWRADGGEPDIALDLAQWLPQEGCEIVRMEPIVEAVRPRDFLWQWPQAFVTVGLARLVELGRVSADVAKQTADDFSARAQDERTLCITPGVLEIVATVSAS